MSNQCAYRLDLQYHGGFFHGWQNQPNAPTVEEALRKAYESFLRMPVFVDGSGRTDMGVHARHQIALLRVSASLPPHALERGVLPFLPEGVAVFRAGCVADDWRPRPALSRQYRYFLWKQTPSPLFYHPYSAWTRYKLNLDTMCEAARPLIGEHDFTSFRAAGCTARHAIRRIDKIMVLNRGPYWEFRITGNAFLRQMVRIIVGTIVDAGRGKISPSEVGTILAGRNRALAGDTMPAQGLWLWKIALPGDVEFPIPQTCWEIPIG